MGGLTLTLVVLLIGLTIRHGLVLLAIFRSRRFLMRECPIKDGVHLGSELTFYIVIPVLREADILRQAIDHFEVITKGRDAAVIVVTTARETYEHAQYPDAADTMSVADELAREGRCIHLHYPDPSGLKADQLNFAATYCSSVISTATHPSQAFLVCYDADSRPLINSLSCFEKSIAQHPHVDVFHQSSRFELRQDETLIPARLIHRLRQAVADAGALRANRFVLAYEIPRLLNRSPVASWMKRQLCSYVYTHVTGHGLCVRLSLLQTLPFPARSPLEDMHYSFLLGSRNLALQPVPSLDTAEVPSSIRTQVDQLSRWFYGPGRFHRYLRDPATVAGWRARLLATSAFVICIEWLSCTILPVALCAALLVWPVNSVLWVLVATFVTIYVCQLLATERLLGSASTRAQRLARFLAYPISCTLFGVSGLIGAFRLMCGASGAGKTERRQP